LGWTVDCATDCATWPEGVDGDQANDTTHCRLYHAEAAADDAALHCPHASPDGGGICVAPPEPSCADALFFSQYVEGGGAHKALEFYNHTGVPVDLSAYALWRLHSGGTWEGDKTVVEFTGSLGPGDVFVLCESDAHDSIEAVCDRVSDDLFSGFGGDDAVALVRDGVIVDQIGEEGPDPGEGWEVSGQNNATKDHTLIRVSSVTEGTTDWAASAADQWLVLEKNDTTGMGDHEVDIPCVCTPACDGAVCGDDGCGGSCGSCDGDQLCQDGVCEVPPCWWDYEPLHFDPCAIEAPTGPLLLTADSTYTYNTDDGTLTGPNAVDPATEVLTTLDPEVRLMIVDRLEIPGDTALEVVGAMPLVVVSLDDIDIQGTVDVSSTLAQLGAGANPATCGSAGGTGGPGTTSGNGSGAGGGGGGLGGEGGDGASPGGNGNFGGDKGLKIAPPAAIRGGCAGGSGGTSGGGDGGGGGGALYLAAQHSISISGVLHAGGAGGEGGQGTGSVPRCGGGGGGSGGYLGLEAPTVTLALNAILAANGGGGGGGTDINSAGNGAHGPAADAPAAAGGTGIENGGSGGIGAISGTPDGGDGLPKSSTRGAGGGGGGLGFIIVNSPALVDQGATLSAVAILPCAPVCEGAACGDDGCGGSCGECGDDAYCAATGQCVSEIEADPCDHHVPDCGPHQVCGWWPSHGTDSCSELCAGPVECAVGEACARVPGSAHLAFCRPSAGGQVAGAWCEWSGDCASGICDGEHCRDACVSQAGCDGELVCRILETGPEIVTACVPNEPIALTPGCAGCASGHCDVFAMPGGEYCADLCATNADCEPVQTCNLVAAATGEHPDTIAYHEDYPGLLTDGVMGCYTAQDGLGDGADGAHCSAHHHCQSGSCLPITGDDEYYCTRPCLQPSDCSEDMVCRLTGMTLVSDYLVEIGESDAGAWSLVRLCDFPSGEPGDGG
jgi:hypothetical protein